MSATTTTVIAALAGLFGVMAGGLLAGRQQRSAQLRDRMLDVSLEYVEALREATPGAPMQPRKATASAQDAMVRARQLGHRVALVFGSDSPAGEHGVEAHFLTLNTFEHAEAELEADTRFEDGVEVATDIWLADHEKLEGRAEREIARFSYLAGRAIRSGGRHPLLDHGRRVRRLIFMRLRCRKALRELSAVQRRVDIATDEQKANYANRRAAMDALEAEWADHDDPTQ